MVLVLAAFAAIVLPETQSYSDGFQVSLNLPTGGLISEPVQDVLAAGSGLVCTAAGLLG